MSKASEKRERTESAVKTLKEWLNPGDTVYTVLMSRSASGMSRKYRVLVTMYDQTNLRPEIVNVTGYVAHATDRRRARKGVWDLIVGGCGFDGGHDIVYALSYALGYATEGKWLKHSSL